MGLEANYSQLEYRFTLKILRPKRISLVQLGLAGVTLLLRIIVDLKLKGFRVDSKLLPKGRGETTPIGVTYPVGHFFNR